MIQKRYQYRSPEGIVWTPWFNTNLKEIPQDEEYQLKNKLKNEYKEIKD